MQRAKVCVRSVTVSGENHMRLVKVKELQSEIADHEAAYLDNTGMIHICSICQQRDRLTSCLYDCYWFQRSVLYRQNQRSVQRGLVAAAGQLRVDAVRCEALWRGWAAGGVGHGVLLLLRQQAPEEGAWVFRPVSHHPRPQSLQRLQLH